MCITLCACALAVFHEEWMCLGMQRNTHITGNNLIPISVPIHFGDAVTCIYRCFQFRSLANCQLIRGRGGTDIGIKLLPVMWVFLCIPRHIHSS